MAAITKTTFSSVSPWWRVGALIALVAGFSVLIGVSVSAYRDAPPVPDKAIGTDGSVVFTGNDIRAGQEIFLKYGLMENGTDRGPDFSAEYLHTVGVAASTALAQQLYSKTPEALTPAEKSAVEAEV